METLERTLKKESACIHYIGSARQFICNVSMHVTYPKCMKTVDVDYENSPEIEGIFLFHS